MQPLHQHWEARNLISEGQNSAELWDINVLLKGQQHVLNVTCFYGHLENRHMLHVTFREGADWSVLRRIQGPGDVRQTTVRSKEKGHNILNKFQPMRDQCRQSLPVSAHVAPKTSGFLFKDTTASGPKPQDLNTSCSPPEHPMTSGSRPEEPHHFLFLPTRQAEETQNVGFCSTYPSSAGVKAPSGPGVINIS